LKEKVMDRTLRGLEDQEARERKSLLRDVRTPGQRIADAFVNGQFQIVGIFAAAPCMMVFPRR
jgi:intracellular multiplication protein IcmO